MGAVNATVTALTHWCPQRRALGETITVEGAGETITVEGATSDAPTNAKISSSTTPPSAYTPWRGAGCPEFIGPTPNYIWKIRRRANAELHLENSTYRLIG